MRLSSIVFIAGVFLSAAVLSLVSARLAANVVEDNSREGVRAALQQAGLDWATVDADGLQVFLAGTAPSEADRFKAVSEAAAVVDARQPGQAARHHRRAHHRPDAGAGSR